MRGAIRTVGNVTKRKSEHSIGGTFGGTFDYSKSIRQMASRNIREASGAYLP